MQFGSSESKLWQDLSIRKPQIRVPLDIKMDYYAFYLDMVDLYGERGKVERHSDRIFQ